MAIDVLIVDDDPDIRGTLAELLEDEGYAVFTLPDANDLIATLAAKQPRLVLLDLTLPGQDLGRTLDQARTQSLLTETAVLALSGREETETVAAELGLQGAVRKPFNLAELLDHVSRACRRESTFRGQSEELHP